MWRPWHTEGNQQNSVAGGNYLLHLHDTLLHLLLLQNPFRGTRAPLRCTVWDSKGNSSDSPGKLALIKDPVGRKWDRRSGGKNHTNTDLLFFFILNRTASKKGEVARGWECSSETKGFSQESWIP